ncbi:hypothetical protein KUTeg_014804, partial [Tegillarca granosa]
MNSCAAVFGLIMLVITDLAIIISFATPYWEESKVLSRSSGLWAFCSSDDCTWIFEDGYRNSDPDWFRATQGLMTVGLCVGLVALIIATLALCCQCRKCNYGILSIGIAVVVFGVKAADSGTRIDWTESRSFNRFGWSFWLAAGSSGMALLTSFIYCCTCRGA